MRHVSIAELKTNADEIVAAAHAGEEIEIMREGRSVAKMVGAERPELVDTRTPEQRKAQREAVDALVALGKQIYARNGPTTAAEIKEWIEGRTRVNVVVDASAIGLVLLRDENQKLAEIAEEVCLWRDFLSRQSGVRKSPACC